MSADQLHDDWNETVPHRQITRDEAVQFFIDRDGPWRVRDKMVAALDLKIAELMSEAEPSDQLWLCGSRQVGVLAGHEGIGRVRNGSMIRYANIRSY